MYLIDVMYLHHTHIAYELSHLLCRQTGVVRLASQRVHQLLQVSSIKSPIIIKVCSIRSVYNECCLIAVVLNVNIDNNPSTTKDSESVVGLDFQGRRIAEGTQEVQEILKAQAAIPHVRGWEDVTYPFPEGVRLWQPTKTQNIVRSQNIYIIYTEVTIYTAEWLNLEGLEDIMLKENRPCFQKH